MLVWSNIADSLAGTTISLTYEVASAPPPYDAGAFIENSASAYTNTDPRTEPRVDDDALPIVTSTTGDDVAAPARTDIVPFTITKTEDNPENEMLRGVHDHKSLYTLQIDNNLVGPTTGFTVVDFLPADLEFLGCGAADNSAPGTEEYPGAGRIDDTPDPVLAETPCVIPSSVTTETVDPDGSGPMELGVYTRVEWDATAIATARGSADLAAGGEFTIEYIAAIPLRENVDTDPIPATANLDNNTGGLTTETEGASHQLRRRQRYLQLLPVDRRRHRLVHRRGHPDHQGRRGSVLQARRRAHLHPRHRHQRVRTVDRPDHGDRHPADRARLRRGATRPLSSPGAQR